MDIKTWSEQRCKCIADAGEIISAAAKEERDCTAEEQQKFEALHAEGDRLLGKIELQQRQGDAEASLEKRNEARSVQRNQDFGNECSMTEPLDDSSGESFEKRHDAAFDRWLRYGDARLGQEDRATMAEATQRARRRDSTFDTDRESRGVLEIKTAGAGPETIPEGFVNRLVAAQLLIGGWRQTRATIMPTATGADLPWPAMDDTSKVATVVAEAADLDGASLTAPAFVQILFKAWKYSAGIVKVSTELTEDTAFDLQSELASAFGARIARGTNAHFTTGDGSGKPLGAVSTAKKLDLGAGTAGGPTFALLNTALHTLNAVYWPNSEWQMNQATLASVRALVDGEARPIFGAPDVSNGRPMTLLGYPITINPALPNWADTAAAVVFGDHSAFKIRDVSTMTLFRFNELYMATGQVGYTMFSRHDANLVDGHYDGTTANSGEAIMAVESST